MRLPAVVLTIALAACGAPSPMGTGELGSRLLDIRRDPVFQWFRFYNGVGEPATVVIRDPEQWRAAWATIVATHSPKPDLPLVDFTKEMVIVVALGTKPSGGYSAEVLRVVRGAYGIDVDYAARSPSDRCFVTGALTQPLDIVIVERVEGTVSFARHEQTTNC